MLESDTFILATSAVAALTAPWRQNLLSIVPSVDSNKKMAIVGRRMYRRHPSGLTSGLLRSTA